MKTNLQLVSFLTSDHLSLPGLLYEPEKKTDRVAIYLHGNGSSSIFYGAEEMNLFGEILNKNGISFFPFNNRGAHWFKKLNAGANDTKSRVLYGMAVELIKECIIDIDSAINYLKKIGYKTFYLIGVSTGANKIVVYHYYRKNNPVGKYVLLSGGDDTGLYFEYNFKKNKKYFFQFLEKCRNVIKNGNGKKLVPRSLVSDPLISYQSLYDTVNPNGDYNIFPFNEYMNKLHLSKKPLFKEYRTIDKPTLKECPNRKLFTFKIIKGADHGFTGKEKELLKIITDWLRD